MAYLDPNGATVNDPTLDPALNDLDRLGTRPYTGFDDVDSGPGPQLMTAATLTGNAVYNQQGEDLGKIDEIMLDVEGGRIAYAVLKSGGFLGMGGKLFAIPWTALELDTSRHAFVMDAPKESFENAPGFDKDNWPTEADVQWHRDVHAHYRAPGFWE